MTRFKARWPGRHFAARSEAARHAFAAVAERPDNGLLLVGEAGAQTVQPFAAARDEASR